jgi:nucleoid DNA-binding protein
MLIFVGMKNKDLALRLARKTGMPSAAAADQVDRVVTEIIENIRHGENVRLPGLGTFVAGEKPRFRFERKPDAKH